MANTVFVSVPDDFENLAWLGCVENFVLKAMAQLGYDGEEVSVLICGDSFIQGLNKTYRNIDSPTDVLSFESGETYIDDSGNPKKNIGDIVISLDALERNAASFNVCMDEELKRLLVHGLLHLHGMDHGAEHIEENVEPKCDMLIMQENLVQLLQDYRVIAG